MFIYPYGMLLYYMCNYNFLQFSFFYLPQQYSLVLRCLRSNSRCLLKFVKCVTHVLTHFPLARDASSLC